MTKRFVTLALTMLVTAVVALNVNAQGAQRDVVNTWTFTWSDETQKALSLTTTWRKDKSNVCYYEVAANNEQIKINNEDIIPGLTFTASESNIGLRSSGLHLANNNSTRIHLASLSAGNIVKITSSGGSSNTAQYLEPESLSDETIKVKEAVDGTKTKSQTYSFEVVAENSYNFKLNGSASLQIQKMEVYENADASNPIEGKSWDFQSLYSTQFTETVLACLPINNNTDGMRWSYNSAPRYEIGSTLESTGPLKVWLSPISETNGLTFTTTATGKIRIMLESSNSLMLINSSGVTVTIPSVPAGGRVSIKTHVAGRVTDNSGNAPSSTENSGKDYIFDIASAGDFTFKITGDVKIYSISVEGPETTALTSENVSVEAVTYNGTEQTAVVKYNSETLTKDTDYTVTGTDVLTNAGSTTFTIAGAGNYTGTVSDLTFTITPKEVTVNSGITANNKVYDGNTTATLVLTGATIDGKVGEDELTVSSATGSFADANVSENKDVTISDIILGGVKAGNYTLSATGNQTTTTATITQATNALIGTLAIEGWTYGTTANTPSGVKAAFGTVAYKYSDAEKGEYGTYEEKVNGTVGTWWVKAFVEGTDNYTAAESSPVSFTISSAATNASYTVEHYQQNIENDEYTKVDGDTQTINTGNAGDQTAAEAKIYEGFTAQSFDQAKIAADGSTVVKIYYTRNSYTISFNSDGGSEVAAINGKYGSTVTAPDDPTKTNCVFEGWYNGNEKYTFSKMPAQNLTLTAHWTIAESVGLTKVSTSKTWTFVNVAENTSYSSLTNFNEGLYIRANSSKTISRNTGSLNIQFSDESSETSYTVALKLSANSSFAPATTLVANDAVTNADAGCLAVTSDIPGTFYVAAKASAKDASKYVQFIFNGIATSVASDKLNATSGDGSYGCKYEYTATEAGTFVIGSTSVGVNVYCIRFEPTKYELTSSVSPENAGTITKKISGETENATETEFYKGMEIVLTATANTGYDFQKWTDGTNDLTAEEDKSLKVTMDAAKTIVANFTALEYSITYDLAGGSLAEGVTNPATYTIESDAITLSNPIKNGFTFAGWTGTGITEATTTVTIAKGSTGDRTYTATWTENASDTYSITLPATVNGNSITADVSSAAKNATVTLTIATAENYSLSTITANNGDVTLSGSGNTRTFTMPAANVTITATWTIIQTDSQDSNTSETYTVTESGGIEVSQVTSTEGATSITISSDKVGDVEVTSIADDAFNSIENKSAIKSVDLSATKITGVEVSRSSGVFRGFPEETMIYLPANNTAASGQKNVIIGGTCSDFVMKDEKSYSIPTSFIATNATLSRTFTSNAYCTLCLPYDVPASSLGGKIYEFSSIEGTTVKMTEDTDGLNANKPYIFVPNSSVGSIETSGSISVSMSNTPNTNNTDFTFKGVFGKKEFTAEEISGGVYGFAADSEHGASVGQFVKASNGAWTEGMRAYLAYSGNLSETGVATTRGEGLPEYLNVVLVSASGSTTNIGRLELMTAEDGSPVYNLNGQRVDNSYKGIVIKNGKKVIKK